MDSSINVYFLANADDAGKEVQVSYEGRGSLVDAGDINQIIEVLNKGEVALRNVDTLEFEVNEAIAVLDSNTYQRASAEEDTKPAIGFVKVSDSEEGEIQLFGPMDGFTGLVAGTRYYLDTVEGDITPTSPSEQGNIRQIVGRALSTTRLLVSISQDYNINP